MPISRSQMNRQLRMGGGIMQVAPRQGALLGGLKKAVSGVAKGIGSFLKSDLGKAALLGVGAFGLPQIGSFGGFKGLLSGKLPSFGLPEFLSGEKTLGKTLKVGAMGSVLGGVLGALDPEEEEQIVSGRNVEALKGKLTQAYRNLGYKEEEIPTLVANDVSEYTKDMARGMANGGRVQYSDGSEGPDDLYTRSYKRVMELMDEGLDFGSAVKQYMKEEKERENKAYGGRMGYNEGTDFQKWLEGKQKFDQGQNAEQLYREYLEDKRRQKVAEQKTMAANGGRIGYNDGTNLKKDFLIKKGYGDMVKNMSVIEIDQLFNSVKGTTTAANTYREPAYMGGRMGYAMGTDQIVDQASGIMGLPQRTNEVGVKELDLRDSGGFIPPVGVKEKADDIPAMLSNNEFVFTADAVRGAGNGNINLGAQRMYDTMKKLEKGGRV